MPLFLYSCILSGAFFSMDINPHSPSHLYSPNPLSSHRIFSIIHDPEPDPGLRESESRIQDASNHTSEDPTDRKKKKRKRNGARKLPGRHLLQQFTLGATSPSFHYGLCNDQRISYAAVPLQLNISCTRLSGSKRGGQYFKDRSARRRTRAPYQRGDAAAGVGQYFWLC